MSRKNGRSKSQIAETSPANLTEVEEKDQSNKELFTNLRKKSYLKIKFKNPHQEEFWNLLNEKEITFCSGPAGSGKSYLSVAKALQLIAEEDSKYKKIIIIKPIIEADEKLGLLPGDIMDKVEPYAYSTLYLFEKLIGKRKLETLLERDTIKIMALAYLRGVNIDNSIVIFEEAQNCSIRQMKTLLTRIGENSKYIISGDISQSDRFKNGKDSGLFFAQEKLTNIKNIGSYYFTDEDIVRNPIIQEILKIFEENNY
jgi:phosphate starvation-inducible PhoH-like protein